MQQLIHTLMPACNFDLALRRCLGSQRDLALRRCQSLTTNSCSLIISYRGLTVIDMAVVSLFMSTILLHIKYYYKVDHTTLNFLPCLFQEKITIVTLSVSVFLPPPSSPVSFNNLCTTLQLVQPPKFSIFNVR